MRSVSAWASHHASRSSSKILPTSQRRHEVPMMGSPEPHKRNPDATSGYGSVAADLRRAMLNLLEDATSSDERSVTTTDAEVRKQGVATCGSPLDDAPLPVVFVRADGRVLQVS